MPIRAYRDIFTACFELNSILYLELISMLTIIFSTIILNYHVVFKSIIGQCSRNIFHD